MAAQVEFQLIKEYYGSTAEAWTEDKTRIQPREVFAPVIKLDGVVKVEATDFTLDDESGIVDFTLMGAPGAGVVLTNALKKQFIQRSSAEEVIIPNRIRN